jgi:hypothetical protein
MMFFTSKGERETDKPMASILHRQTYHPNLESIWILKRHGCLFLGNHAFFVYLSKCCHCDAEVSAETILKKQLKTTEEWKNE